MMSSLLLHEQFCSISKIPCLDTVLTRALFTINADSDYVPHPHPFNKTAVLLRLAKNQQQYYTQSQ